MEWRMSMSEQKHEYYDGNYASSGYKTTNMQRDIIINKLRERGCRITKQRLMLLDIILEEEFSCCKEIYYRAVKKDAGIGTATVYRMLNTLEEMGAISRKNMYKITYDDEGEKAPYEIELDDGTIIKLTAKKWGEVIKKGLYSCGYIGAQDIREVKCC